MRRMAATTLTSRFWMRVFISGLRTAVHSLRELARVRREQADQVCFPATVTAPYLATEPNARQVKSELDQRRVQRQKSRADAKWESELHFRVTELRKAGEVMRIRRGQQAKKELELERRQGAMQLQAAVRRSEAMQASSEEQRPIPNPDTKSNPCQC